MKLNQVIAIEKGVKSRCAKIIDTSYKILQQSGIFDGFYKSYNPLDENGEMYPPEKKIVRTTVPMVLDQVREAYEELINTVYVKDASNMVAKADLVVDGLTLVHDCPVPFLLFLEKQAVDIKTMIEKCPTLNSDEEWMFDMEARFYKTEPTETHKTKKIEEPIVMYDATPEHPAQTKLISKDVLVGHWKHIKHSGALPAEDKNRMIKKIHKFIDAVKQARERANETEIGHGPNDSLIGESIVGYLFSS